MDPGHALEADCILLGEIPRMLCNQKVIATRIQSEFHFV